MVKKYSSNLDSINLIAPAILIGYLCLGFVPNLQAVDKIAPQWVGMTLLNILSLKNLIFQIFF